MRIGISDALLASKRTREQYLREFMGRDLVISALSAHGNPLHPNRNPSLLAEGVARFSHLPAGHGEGWSDTLRNLMAEVYDFIHAGKSPMRHAPTFPTFQDGLVEAQLVTAILESHRRGTWVQGPPVAEREAVPS